MGEVYLCRVHDSLHDRDGVVPLPDVVAVKKLFQRLHSTAIQRLQREFSLLRDLDHPGLVKVFDFLIHDQDAYLIMEYIPGKPLSSINGNYSKQPAAIAGIFEQTLGALSYIHASGVIHRDIKPSNILVSEDRNRLVKLTDFGLAFSMDPGAEILTESGELIGSIPYMPPELLRGLAPDPRSDLYSLGITVFELITGRLPFIGETTLGTMLQQINDLPPSPRSFNKRIPGWLERIVLRLLEKDREDRFQSANDVREAIRSKESAPATSRREKPITDQSPDMGGLLFPSGPFAGRSLELKHLENMFEGVLGGMGQGILLSGRPGVGKSRLVKEFRRKATQRRCLVFSSAETSYRFSPFGAFEPIVSRIANQPGIIDERDDRLTNLCRAFKQSILPEEETSAFEAVGDFIEGTGERMPLVIILDNVSLEDTGTLDLFLFLLQRLADSRILILLLTRDEPSDFGKSLDRFRIENNFGQLVVDDLDSESMFEMVGRTLGVPDMPRGFLLDLYKLTKGNPLLVRETLDLLVQEKKIVRAGKKWELREPETLKLLPIREMMRIKLAGLTTRLLETIRICAVAGRRCDINLIEEYLGDGSEVEQLIEQLVAHRILHYEGADELEAVAFLSSSVRELVYETMPDNLRIRIHGEIARIISTGREPSRAGIAAYHYIKAGEDILAVEQLVESSALAESLKSYELAISTLTTALELTGKFQEQKKPEIVEQTFWLHARRGGFLSKRGRLDEGLIDFENAKTHAESGARKDLVAIALNLIGNTLRLLTKHDEALKMLLEALRLNKELGNTNGIYYNLHNLGLTHLGMGQISESRRVFSEMAEVSQRNKNAEMRAVAYNSLGMLSKREGNLEEAEGFYGKALKLRIASGQTQMAGIVCNNRALILRELANIREAEAEYRKSIALLLEAGSRAEEAFVYNNLAEILIDQGRFITAGEYIERAELTASRYRDVGTESEAARNAGLLAIYRGRFGEAVEKIRKAGELAALSGLAERIGMAKTAAIRLTAALEDSYPKPEEILASGTGAAEFYDLKREIVELTSRSMVFHGLDGWQDMLEKVLKNETPFWRIKFGFILGELLYRTEEKTAAASILQKVYNEASSAELRPLADICFLLLYKEGSGLKDDLAKLREILDRNLDEGAFGVAAYAALPVIESAQKSEALSTARRMIEVILDSIRSTPFPLRHRLLGSGWRREVTMKLSGINDPYIIRGFEEIRNLTSQPA